MRTYVSAVILAVSWLAVDAELHAQSTTIDEGTFRITVQGVAAGHETFAIREWRAGAEVQVFATGEIEMTGPEGLVDLRPALETTGGDMAVSAYQVKVSGQQQQEIYLTLGDGRFLTRVTSERGEQQREFRAAAGTLLLDTGVAHQYHFLASRVPTGGGTIPVIVPREGRQFDLRVTEVGQESITIGQRAVQARHLRVEGNQEVRDVWVDGSGRVLRVDHPASGYSAVRESLP
jgi:hypothetical protein